MNREPTWRFSISHLCGNTGAAILLILSIVMGGGAGFINIPSLMIVFGIAFFLMFACFGGEYMRFLGASFALLAFRPVKPNQRYAEMARYAARFMMAAGVAGTLIGFIQMLRNMTDPSSIGSGMAVALITVLYAVLAGEFCCLVAFKSFSCDGPEAQPSDAVPLPTAYPLGIAVGVALWTVLLFMLMLLAFSTFTESSTTHNSDVSAYSTEEPGAQHHFLNLGAFRINVGQGTEAGVLQVRPVLSLTDPPCRLSTNFGPILRDVFQSALRSAYEQRKPEDQHNPDALKAPIILLMNEKIAPLTENRIHDLFFEEFVVQ